MGQAVQPRVVPVVLPKVPRSQLVQEAAPVASVVSPSLHCWQRVKSKSLVDLFQPIGQNAQPIPKPKLPAPHDWQTVLPGPMVYFPSVQDLQEYCSAELV